MHHVAIAEIADSQQIIALNLINYLFCIILLFRPISLIEEFCCMSNVNIIVDTKLQPNNNLCKFQIKQNRCTSNERTDQRNKPI